MKKIMLMAIVAGAVCVLTIIAIAMAIPVSTNESPQTVKEAETPEAPEATETENKWYTGDVVIIKKEDCNFFAHMSKDGKESWIYKVRIKKDGIKKLTFPTEVNNAPVTRIGYGEELYGEDDDWIYTIFNSTLEPWHNAYDTDYPKADNITYIEFPETLTRIEAGAFCGLKKLKKVEIPDGVEALPSYIFAACKELTEVKLPAGLKAFNIVAFEKSKAIKKLSVPSESTEFRTQKGYLLSKDSKNIVWVPPALKKVSIPDGVTELDYSALSDSQAEEITIPKSVGKIGSDALDGEKIKKVTVKKGNKVYKMDGGCIYKKSDKSLTAILVKDKWAKVSSKVKVLGDGISVMGVRVKNIKRVDIPESVKKVTGKWEFYSKYTSNWLVKVYFHRKTPPQIVGKNADFPTFTHIYVPKKAKKDYIRWAEEEDKYVSVKKWSQKYLHTF